MSLSHALHPPSPVEVAIGGRAHTARIRHKSPKKTMNPKESPINDDSSKHQSITIELPTPPKTAPIQSPRIHKILSEKDQFFSNIDKYLEEQLKEEPSDADKLHVYKKCFDYLCKDFVLIRPLLERIKKEYDNYANNLIERKRQIVTDSELSFAAEDSYSVIVTQLRNAKNKEFKIMKDEAEKKLDALTELRLQRSSLIKSFEQLTEKNNLLNEQLNMEKSKILEMTVQNENLKAEAKITKMERKEHKKTILSLEETLDKASTGVKSLVENKTNITQKIDTISQYKQQISDEVEQLRRMKEENENLLIEKTRKVADLERERTNNTEKLRSITQRNAQNETKMRAMLNEIGIMGEDQTPINELYVRLVKRNRRQSIEEMHTPEPPPQE